MIYIYISYICHTSSCSFAFKIFPLGSSFISSLLQVANGSEVLRLVGLSTTLWLCCKVGSWTKHLGRLGSLLLRLLRPGRNSAQNPLFLGPFSLRRPCALALCMIFYLSLSKVRRPPTRVLEISCLMIIGHIKISPHMRLGARSMHHGSYYNILDPKLEQR